MHVRFDENVVCQSNFCRQYSQLTEINERGANWTTDEELALIDHANLREDSIFGKMKGCGHYKAKWLAGDLWYIKYVCSLYFPQLLKLFQNKKLPRQYKHWTVKCEWYWYSICSYRDSYFPNRNFATNNF